MKNLRVVLLSGAVAAVGCVGDVDSNSVRKGTIDEGSLVEGVTVTLEGRLGMVTLPFSEPVPNVATEDFEDEIESVVSLQIASKESGASADLMSGVLVSETPAAPGEYTWTLSDDRTEATVSFFNQATNGLSMSAGAEYAVQLNVISNEYINRVPGIAFDATVVGGGHH